MAPPASFRLIDGGRRPRWIGSTRIEVGARPSFPIDALAVEDDTYFVLAAPAIAGAPAQHPIKLWTDVWAVDPAPLGSVSIHRDRPLTLHAVVHDLDCNPSWRGRWVAAALVAILGELRQRGIGRLGLEPLGMVHGRMRPARFVELLTSALTDVESDAPKAVWLIADGEAGSALEAALDASHRAASLPATP